MQCCVCGSECEAGVCRRCGCAVYCSKQCQARDWPSHREHCRPHLLKLTSAPARGGTGVTATENIGPGTRSGELSHWSKSLEILCADWCRSFYALKTQLKAPKLLGAFFAFRCVFMAGKGSIIGAGVSNIMITTIIDFLSTSQCLDVRLGPVTGVPHSTHLSSDLQDI